MEPVEPRFLVRPSEFGLGPLGESEAPPKMAVPKSCFLAGLPKSFERVLPDRLEHREAGLLLRALQPDEALVDQRRQAVEHVEVAPADALGGLERPAAREDGQAGEELAARARSGGRGSSRASPGESGAAPADRAGLRSGGRVARRAARAARPAAAGRRALRRARSQAAGRRACGRWLRRRAHSPRSARNRVGSPVPAPRTGGPPRWLRRRPSRR